MIMRITIDGVCYRLKGDPMDVAWHRVAPKNKPDYQVPTFVEVAPKTYEVHGSITGRVIGTVFLPPKAKS